MSGSAISPLRQLWNRWKALQLPWRKRWLAGTITIHPSSHHLSILLIRLTGTDLAGNKYWYFRPSLSTRPRRILQNNPRIPYSDVQIPVQWHQWLRYTRPSAPSIPELQSDAARQAQLKQLARAADDRWAAKPSVLDKPRRGNLELGIGDGEMTGTVGVKGETGEGKGVSRMEKEEDVRRKEREGGEKGKQNPWGVRKGRAGEDWKPESWTPTGRVEN